MNLMQHFYQASLRLWNISGAERHAEGHPGVSGPTGSGSWDEQEGYRLGALACLKDILGKGSKLDIKKSYKQDLRKDMLNEEDIHQAIAAIDNILLENRNICV